MKGMEEPSPSVPRQELQAQPLPQGQVQPGCRVQSHTGPTMLSDSDIQSLQTQGCSCCWVAGVRPKRTHTSRWFVLPRDRFGLWLGCARVLVLAGTPRSWSELLPRGFGCPEALTYHRGCHWQGWAGSGHAEPPLCLQAAGAVLVGDTCGDAHATGG